MKGRYFLSVVEMGESFNALLYDFERREIVGDVVDYADLLISRLKMKRTSIAQEIGHLRVFVGYLGSRGLEISDCSDEVLAAFRDYAFEKIPSGRSRDRMISDVARTTVNAKLIRVYDWLKWLQENGRLPKNSIGSNNCRVESHLLGSSLSHASPLNAKLKVVDRYPLLLGVVLRRKNNRVPKYVPTEETVDALHEYFLDSEKSLHVRYRNMLLVDVAAYTGFRRGSIQSLAIGQFIGKDFELTDRDTVLIRPARQKRSYGDYFEIPLDLHQNICKFIQTQRSAHLRMKNFSEVQAKNALFISDRNCAPLDDRSITAIISEALRACGAPKGVAIHSFRAKFLIEAIALEYEDRKNLGLDTSVESISRSVATKAGHKSTKSIRPYTDGNEASKLVKHHSGQARRAKESAAENESLKQQIKELEDQVEKLRKNLGKPSLD